MALKKKYLGFLKLLFSLLFMLSFVNGFTVCRAEDERYIQLSATQVETLATMLGLSNYYSGDYIYTWQETFNQWMRTQEASTGFDWANYNIFFYVPSGNNFIAWTYVRRQEGQGDDSGIDLYIETLNPNSTGLQLRGFRNWNRDSNNSIIGVNYNSYYRYYIASNYPNTVRLDTISNSSYTPITIPNGSISIDRNSVGEYDCYISRFVLWEPHQFKYHIQRVAGRNTSIPTGYSYFWLDNFLGNGSGDPTPTPTPTPTGGGGGGSTDLTETNQLISDVKDSIDDLEDTLTDVPDLSTTTITSGEIIGSIGLNISGDPYDNFWLFLTSGLSNALSSSNRIIYFEFLGSTHAINLDNTIPHYPEGLQALMEIICIYGITIIIVKQIHEMTILIQSGNMDKVLEMNEESGIVDLF